MSRGDDGASIRVTARRHGVESGSDVLVEVSFGALSDEILLHGVVEDIEAGDEHAYTIRVAAAHAERLEYVRAVLAGEREPVVRRYRRVEYTTPVVWKARGQIHRGRTADLGCGGVFVVEASTTPARGDKLDLRMTVEGSKVELAAEVTWIGSARGEDGFGVRFLGLERAEFELIRNLVAARETDDG